MTHRQQAALIDKRIASTLERCTCGHQRRTHAGATADNDGGNECYGKSKDADGLICECPLFTKRS